MSSIEALDPPEIVNSLLSFAGDRQDEIRGAGLRVMDRIRSKRGREVLKKRLAICREVQLLDRARERVLLLDSILQPRKEETAENLLDPTLSSGDQWQYNDAVMVVREYQAKHGDLGETTAIDAAAMYYAEKYREGQLDEGEELTPTEELVERRRAAFDLVNVEIGSHRAPYELARETVEFVRRAAKDDVPWIQATWCEAAVLVLAIESPDTPAEALGIDEDLPMGTWDETGDDFFNCREGMRAYMDRSSADPERAENDQRFWGLARSCVRHLMAEAPDIGDADEPLATSTQELDPADSSTAATAPSQDPGPELVAVLEPVAEPVDLSTEERDQDQVAQPTVRLYRKGAIWEMTYGDRTVAFKHLVGFQYISELVASPNESIKAKALLLSAGKKVVQTGDRPATAADVWTDTMVDQNAQALEGPAPGTSPSPLDMMIEDEARQNVQEMAESHEKAREKNQGRHKQQGQRVGKAIAAARDQIAKEIQVVANHLQRAIVGPFGADPVYRPAADDRVVWVLV